jgi:hypothetical protein
VNILERELAQLRQRRVALRGAIRQAQFIGGDPIEQQRLVDYYRCELRWSEERAAQLSATLGKAWPLPSVSLKLTDEDRRRISAKAAPASVRSSTPVRASSGMQRVTVPMVIKELQGEERTFSGIATSNTLDHCGDIVEPGGAQYSMPLPLILGHERESPVGEVVSATPQGNHIVVTAQIRDVPEPGAVQDLCNKAWHLIKYRLAKNLSIGFLPIERERLPDGNGWRFTRWKWLETSIVVIGACPDAVITGTR